VGLCGPSPRRQRNGHADRLHVSGWHVDDQALDACTFGHGLQVIADGIDVPIVFKIDARFNRRPSCLRKFPETAPIFLCPDLLQGETAQKLVQSR